MRKRPSKVLQQVIPRRPLPLVVGVILAWGIIPWLYLAPPEFLWGRPIALYAAFCLVGGLAVLCALILSILKGMAGKYGWAGRLSGRGGRLLLITVMTGLVAGPYFVSPLAPSQCAYNSVIVAIADAQGQNCTRTCTNWEAGDCGGWSSCFNKNISCVDGIDQNGRECQGCCFDCQVVCEPTDDPPSISGTIACDGWGNSLWCLSNARLWLTTSDPQGYATSISGTLNGAPFSCGSACVLELPNGTGSASFQVTAATSGMTDSGSATWAYDPEDPNVGLEASGTSGEEGWYISNVEVMASGADSISGLAGVLLSVDGGPWQATAVLTDGVHTVDVSGQDQAGNVASAAALVSVDTITPSLNLSLSGALGTSGWYTTAVQLGASASDSGSGLASLEVSTDGSGYRAYTEPVWFSGGQHSYQFRASDHAGNLTETPLQILNIDATGPTISLPAAWELGQTVTYNVQDSASGLVAVRVVVEDENERWPKVAWNENVSGNSFSGEIDWNGRFKDGTAAPAGEYYATVKASDRAGNEAWKTGRINVAGQGLMQMFAPPGSVPTEASAEPALILPVPGPAPQTFGGATNSPTSGVVSHSLSLTASAGGARFPLPWAPIAAAAALGASAAYVSGQRKVDPRAKAYRQIGRLYQQAMIEKKEREQEAREQELADLAVAREQARQKAEERARTALGYAMLRQQAAEKEKIVQPKAKRSGKGPGLNAPVLDPPDKDPLWKRILKWVGSFFQVKPRTSVPTPDVKALYTQAAQTMLPQFTQTAQARIIPTPSATPTAIPTSTPTPHLWPIGYIINGQGANFRSGPSTKDKNIQELACGETINIGTEQVTSDGYNWRKVLYAGQEGWIVEKYLDDERPVCPNFAAKGAKYPGAGEIVQISRLPFDYPDPASLPSWWGFGDTTFARDNPGFYKYTSGLHSGVDWGMPPNTPLIWAGSQQGVVVKSSTFIYMKDPNYIVIESGGFHFIYGHISSSLVQEGQIINLGDQVGYSGQPPVGDPHLHFEVRPAPTDGAKSPYVINPLTFFSSELQSEWVPRFAGDYFDGNDGPVSLGYFQNTLVQQ